MNLMSENTSYSSVSLSIGDFDGMRTNCLYNEFAISQQVTIRMYFFTIEQPVFHQKYFLLKH